MALTFANENAAKQITAALYPNARKFNLIDHGYDNLVILVDNVYAVRFPRKEGAYRRSLYERLVLEELEAIQDVSIPKVLSVHANPPYLVTSFVHGIHLSTQEVREFPATLRHQLGVDIANFAYSMHSILSVDEATNLRHKFNLDLQVEEPWNVYIKKKLLDYTFPTTEQDTIAKEYYTLWKQLRGQAVVIHDDLHLENLLFQDQKLYGVLDFGDTTIGTVEQELRQLFRIDESVAKSAAERYSRLVNRPIDLEAMKTWAIVQELAVYSDRLSSKNTKEQAFARASNNLNAWLKRGEWGKGFIDLTTAFSRQ